MQLEGDLLGAAVFDAIIFAIELFVATIIILRRHVGLERFFFFAYILVTFSAFNIFIQVVHDFNIPIARTALFKIPLVGQLYLFDAITLTGCLYIFARYISGRVRLRFSASGSRGIFYQLYYRDLAIFLLSSISFAILIYGGGRGDFASQIRPLRGLAMGLFFSWLFIRLLDGVVSDINLRRIILTFVLLDFINIAGEFFSAPLFGKYLWDRGGHKVILLDQANYMLALCYLPLLFSWKRLGIIPTLFGYCIFLALLYDYIKGLFFFIPLSLISYTLMSLALNRRVLRYFIVLTALISLAGAILLPYVLQDRAIKGTRSIQLSSYANYIQEHSSLVLIGSGMGGMYPVLEETDDKGEIKEVDRDADSSDVYQVQFQVPFVFYFKIAGIIGLSVVLFSFFYGLVFSAAINKKDRIAGYYSIIACLSALLVPPFLNPEPNEIIYFGRLSFMVAALSISARRRYHKL